MEFLELITAKAGFERLKTSQNKWLVEVEELHLISTQLLQRTLYIFTVTL